MPNIKPSRKGTWLNSAQYFRLPPPRTRKRMTLIRVIPRVADLTMVKDSNPNPVGTFNTKIRNHGRTVESKQSSAELTLMTYDSECLDIDQNAKKYRDVCVETEIIKQPSSDISLLTLQMDDVMTVGTDPECLARITQIENDCKRNGQQILYPEQLCDQIEQKKENVDRKLNCDPMIDSEEKHSNWWRNSGQTILHFFTKILSRRETVITTKRSTDNVSSITKQHGRRVRRLPKGKKNYNRYRKDIDDGITLKRVNNGYTVNRLGRDENRHGVTGSKSREEGPSILVRQIQRTRDKNLRIVLLEQELRAHLPKADECLTLNCALNVRQLSSPLC